MITFEHVEGVGMRAKYRIRKNGKHVASLYRFGVRSGWEIYSSNYGLTLGDGFRTLDRAKEVALTLAYPSAQEAYETVCETVIKRRRTYKENLHAHDLARLARELVAGSNSAREDIENLVTEIETWIADRTDTQAAAQAEADRLWRETGKQHYVHPATVPYYPSPPAPK